MTFMAMCRKYCSRLNWILKFRRFLNLKRSKKQYLKLKSLRLFKKEVEKFLEFKAFLIFLLKSIRTHKTTTATFYLESPKNARTCLVISIEFFGNSNYIYFISFFYNKYAKSYSRSIFSRQFFPRLDKFLCISLKNITTH